MATFALLVPPLARAQPAPGAQPMGGRVSDGAASISQTSTTTTVTQTTARAAVNWQSFDVGSQQRVTFAQPSASSITLNRVTSGTPSEIAGRIDANGQIAIVNQSGVVFHQGAQVNAAAVMVSAPGISDRNFMAGRMVFDQPAKPDARVENRGTITVKQAGLAALVAPQVVNSGVINARLGQVVLAGARTATLDLYGDGLLSLDVTNQVKQTPLDASGKAATALVTNSGVIIADGGTVQLTARAADGIVQNLVQAGGKIRAATIGDKTGVVALNGIGGSISIEGNVSATGTASGTTGGRVQALTNKAITVASGAKIDVSGRAGGGTVALGTTLARAANTSLTGAPTASSTAVQKGALVIADATEIGPGGRVVLLASGTTSLDGSVSAQGGKKGGDGGFLEVSGGQVGLTGSVNLGAQRGQFGEILLDPQDLVISDGPVAAEFISYTPPNTFPAVGANDLNPYNVWIAPAALQSLTVGTILLAASHNLTVASPLTLSIPGQSLTLTAGNNLAVASPISAPGSITLEGNGSVAVSAPLFSSGTGTVLLTSSGGGVTLSAPVSTGGSIFLEAAGPITVTGPLGSTGIGNIFLNSGAGALTISAPVSSEGSIALNESGTGGIQLAAPMMASTVTMSSPLGPITQTAGVITTKALDVTAASATFNAGNQVDALTFAVTNNFEFTNAKPLQIPKRNVTINEEQVTVDNTAGTLNLSTTDALTVTGAIQTNGTTLLQAGTDLTLTQGVSLLPPPPIQIQLEAVALATVIGGAGGGITLDAGRNIAISAPVTVAIPPPDVILPKGVIAQAGLTDVAGTLNIKAPVDGGAGGVLLSSRSGGMTISARVAGGSGPVTLLSDGPLTFLPGAAIDTGTTLEVAPNTPGTAMHVGGSGRGLMFEDALPGPSIEAAPASLIRFGAFTDPQTGAQVTTAGEITLGSNWYPSKVTTLDLHASGAVSQTAPIINLYPDGILTGAAGSLKLTDSGNQVAQFGPFATTSDLAVSTGLNLSIVGAVSARNIGLDVATAGGLLSLQPGLEVRGAVVRGPGTLSVPAGNRISIASDQVSFATGGNGPLAPRIIAPAGIVEIAPFTSGRPVDLGSPVPVEIGPTDHLLISGADLATIAPAAQTLRIGQVTGALGPSAGPILVVAPLSLAGTASTLVLDSRGAITQQPGDAVTVGTLSGQGTSLLFDQANVVGTLGAFSTTGAFSLTNATNLAISGPLVVGGAAALNVTGALTLAGPITVPDNLQLIATGSIERTGGAFVAGTLSGSARTDADFGSVTVSKLGSFTSGGRLNLATTGDLTVAGPISADTSDLRAGADLTISGPVTASTLNLTAGGGIDATGALTVGILTGSAGRDAEFDAASSIATLRGFSTTSGFTLVDNRSLVVAGSVQDTGAASTLAITTTTGDITLAGDVSGVHVNLDSAGAISQPGGRLIAGTLTGNAKTSASLTQPTNLIGTLGLFSVPNGTLTLIDDPPLTITGPVTANNFDIVAAGSLVLAGNIIGLGTGESTLQVVRVSEGGNTSFVQTGAVTLAGAAGSAPVVRIVLPDGTMTFARLSANGIALVLDAGTASISGTMAVGALTVIGEGGSAVLRGSVAGDTTEAAATIARIAPEPDRRYTFNGCEIGLAFCVATVPPLGQTSSFGPLIERQLLLTGLPPLLELRPVTPVLLPFPAPPPPPRVTDSGRRAPGGRLTGHDHLAPPRQLTDPDVVPPNISERDY